MIPEQLDDAAILDELIQDLRDRTRSTTDFDERMKLNDRLLKALGMKARARNRRKGKGFDLGKHE